MKIMLVRPDYAKNYASTIYSSLYGRPRVNFMYDSKSIFFFIRIFLSKNMRLKNYQHLLKNFLGIYRG